MIALLLFAAAMSPADEGYDRCMETAVTNPDFVDCGMGLLDRRDAELNRAWKAAWAALDKPTQAELLAEQRLWLAFRDKSCGYWRTGAFGRDGQTVHFYTCRAGVIDARIEYLEAIGDDGVPDGEASSGNE